MGSALLPTPFPAAKNQENEYVTEKREGFFFAEFLTPAPAFMVWNFLLLGTDPKLKGGKLYCSC